MRIKNTFTAPSAADEAAKLLNPMGGPMGFKVVEMR